jgi:hypothetical protein
VCGEGNVRVGGWCTVPTSAVQEEIALTCEWSRWCFWCFSLTNEPTMIVIFAVSEPLVCGNYVGLSIFKLSY